MLKSVHFRQGSVLPTQCGVEQWFARRSHNPKVAGSSPVPAIHVSGLERAETCSFLCAFAFRSIARLQLPSRCCTPRIAIFPQMWIFQEKCVYEFPSRTISSFRRNRTKDGEKSMNHNNGPAFRAMRSFEDFHYWHRHYAPHSPEHIWAHELTQLQLGIAVYEAMLQELDKQEIMAARAAIVQALEERIAVQHAHG